MQGYTSHIVSASEFMEACRIWPVLHEIDRALREAPVRSGRELHTILGEVYAAIDCLPVCWQITVACHLGRVADDRLDAWEATR